MLANNPSVLTGGGVATNLVNGTGLFANGTAAAPSISFASETGTGFFRQSAGVLGLAIAGVLTFRMFNPSAGGRLLGGVVNNTLLLDDAGGISLLAAGTNQNITLTPSGSGRVSLFGTPSSTGSALNGSLDVTDVTAIAAGIGGMISFRGYYTGTSATEYGFIRGYKINATDGNYAGGLYFGTRANGAGMSGWMLLNDAGKLLLGTTTDSSNGILQLATHTTSAGGIGFGTDISLYRANATDLYTTATRIASSTAGNFYIGTQTNSQFVLQTNLTNCLIFDTAQNSLFYGIIVHKSYTVATLPAAAAGNTYGTTFVSDATNAAGTGIGTAPTGGGAVKRAVYSTGAAWLLL